MNSNASDDDYTWADECISERVGPREYAMSAISSNKYVM